MSDADDVTKKAAYEAWAQRMRTKKHDDKRDFGGRVDEPGSDATGPSGYWSAESLYRDSELQREHGLEEQRKQTKINSLLATLDLPPGSSLKDCSDRVKQLARQVHPDMNLDKTARSGAVQLEKMIEINAAYEELKRLLS